MNEEKPHITEYATYAKAVIAILFLAAINIVLTGIKPVPFTPAIIMVISCVQAYIALAYLMHLKFDSGLFRFLVFGVFFLFFIVIVILFLDYKLR